MEKKGEIVKSHRMMNARDGLLTHQHKILGLALSKLNPYQDELPRVDLTYKEYCQISGEKFENKHYQRFYQTARKALKRSIFIETGDGDGWSDFTLCPTVHGKDGVINISFNQDLKLHFIEIHEKFAKLGLDVYFTLKKDYSSGFYEILKTREMQADKNGLFFVDLTIEEIRQKFLLGEKYKEYKHLKQRVILDSLNELSEKTDITYNRLEEFGRPVERVRIWAIRKPPKRLEQVQNSLEKELLERPKEHLPFLSPTFFETMEKREEPKPITKLKRPLSEKQLAVIRSYKNKFPWTENHEKSLNENPVKLIGEMMRELKKEAKEPEKEVVAVQVKPEPVVEKKKKFFGIF